MLRLLAPALIALAALAAPAAAHQGAMLERQTDLMDAAAALGGPVPRAAAAPPPATPKADCEPGSKPEPGLQGRVPAGSKGGYHCNLTQIGHEGTSAGFKVERFVDRAGHECAYYDTDLVFPTNAPYLDSRPSGVAVLDMSDPARPKRTETLTTPAMRSPHESLLVNQKRGLLAAVLGGPTAAPGEVDLYDLNGDCRHPVLQSALPVGFLGHESGFAPDGRTFYATSLYTGTITAVDVSDPKAPSTVWTGQYSSHGMTVSDDGNRGYLAALGGGLTILDLSEIQARKPNPQARVVSRLGWERLSIPQVALPVTIDGTPYLVEVDEFSTAQRGGTLPASNGPFVGAARIIDVSDERRPQIVSDLRLEVNQPEHRAAIADDPGAQSPGQGYAAHYCGVPRAKEPGIVACSFIASGLRVFDIRNPYEPAELAYFVAPPTVSPVTPEASNYAMSRPAFAPKRREIWYSDAASGFYALRAGFGVWPFDPGSHLTLPVPRARRCASGRSFVIHLRHRLRSARVYVGGKRVPVRRRGGRLTARVNLRGRRKGTVRVRIVARTRSGRRVTETRRYRTCAKRE